MGVSTGMQGRTAFYDRFFQENYPVLKRWALQITVYDKELAEDLLHDVYLRFSQRNEQLEDIESIRGYLYAAMKNSYLSYVRRRTRMGPMQLSHLLEEETFNASITNDPTNILRIQDDLRAICHYACNRKSTSISASILILRFIHGYYSAEVARVINRSRNAVEARLLKARQEAGYYLLFPFEQVGNSWKAARPKDRKMKHFGDVLSELRQTVFDAVEGRCFTNERLKRVYRQSHSGLDRGEASHLVSCRTCLDDVNRLLHMPLLSERHPLDSIGPQSVIEVLERGRSMVAGTGI